MYALVEFQNNETGIYPESRITKTDESNCVVKHKGCKYEAILISMHESQNILQLAEKSYLSGKQAEMREMLAIDGDDCKESHTGTLTNLSCVTEKINIISNIVVSQTGSSSTTTCIPDTDNMSRILEVTSTDTDKEISLMDFSIGSDLRGISTSSFILNDSEESVEFNTDVEDKENVPDFEDISDNSDEDPLYEPKEADSDNDQFDLESSESNNNKLELSASSKKEHLSDCSTLPGIPNTSANLSSACDDSNLMVDYSQGKSGDGKFNVCLYCCTKQKKNSRHLEKKHKDEEDVKKFIVLPKGCPERKEIIGIIRKKGNFNYNTKLRINDGHLVVSRRPNNKHSRTGRDFKPCGNCKAFFSKNSLRAHFRKCTGISSDTRRYVTVLSKKIAGRIHSVASKNVREKLFPLLREDNIVRLIRYDQLIIIYANKMCDKYIHIRYFEMIRQRIRLIGRFLSALKEINSEVTDLNSIYDPKFCDDVLKAINSVGGLDENSGIFKVPTAAFSLGTLIKQICNIRINECIKNHQEENRQNAENFLKLFTHDIALNTNRAVGESQLQQQRRKKTELPPTSDIKKFQNYLCNNRKQAYNQLNTSFTVLAWIKLSEITLVSMQLFNRRRPGELERILIEDYQSYHGIDENTDKDLYESLSIKNKEVANKYVRFAIRGKLNRTVPVLLDNEQVACIELILKHREHAKVHKNNPYVFGIGDHSSDHKYLRACNLMRKYSLLCGAEHPERLRATKLRKHIATTCIRLNLEDQEVNDLANFMGHHEKIHRDIYRQPVVSREILRMSQLLEVAQEGLNSDSSCEEVASPELPSKRKRSTSPYGSVKRTKWSEEEKNIVKHEFKSNLRSGKLPSFKDIQVVITKNPALKRRTVAQVKTWIHNQTRDKHRA